MAHGASLFYILRYDNVIEKRRLKSNIYLNKQDCEFTHIYGMGVIVLGRWVTRVPPF